MLTPEEAEQIRQIVREEVEAAKKKPHYVNLENIVEYLKEPMPLESVIRQMQTTNAPTELFGSVGEDFPEKQELKMCTRNPDYACINDCTHWCRLQ